MFHDIAMQEFKRNYLSHGQVSSIAKCAWTMAKVMMQESGNYNITSSMKYMNLNCVFNSITSRIKVSSLLSGFLLNHMPQLQQYNQNVIGYRYVCQVYGGP